MEKIARRNGVLYYGDKICSSVEEAYSRFREDYHKSIGKATYQRLDRLGQRIERLHGYGFVFDTEPEEFPCKKTDCRIMGLLGISYVRMIGIWDYPDVSEEDFDKWFDYAFSRKGKALKTVGRKLKTGRTSRRLKTHYR